MAVPLASSVASLQPLWTLHWLLIVSSMLHALLCLEASPFIFLLLKRPISLSPWRSAYPGDLNTNRFFPGKSLRYSSSSLQGSAPQYVISDLLEHLLHIIISQIDVLSLCLPSWRSSTRAGVIFLLTAVITDKSRLPGCLFSSSIWQPCGHVILCDSVSSFIKWGYE